MEFHQIVLMCLQIINVLSKKHGISSSGESIENLLYYKGCQHSKEEEPTTSPPLTRLARPIKPKPMDCPYPKMCCSLTCGGNECESSSPFMGRQNGMDPALMEQNFPPIGPPNEPLQNHPQLNRGKKKKDKQPKRMPLQPPIGGRRSFGVTKERIKNLINQDDDIRKILKDLVKVTMKKVDLVDMINRNQASTQPSVIRQNSNTGFNSENEEDDDYDLD